MIEKGRAWARNPSPVVACIATCPGLAGTPDGQHRVVGKLDTPTRVLRDKALKAIA